MELDPNKNIYIFPNEYCKETASEINQREVPEADFICKTLQWYKNTIVSCLSRQCLFLDSGLDQFPADLQ